MKTTFKINEKAISQSCKKANEYRKNAIVNFKRAMLIMTCLFIFCIVESQDFEKINFFNKTSTQISSRPIIVKDCMLFNSDHYKNGDLFIGYLSPEFGTIVYIFDSLNYCYKIMVYTKPDRKLIINPTLYNVLTLTDNDKIIYSIRVKSKNIPIQQQ